MVLFLTLSALPGAGWFIEQNKRKAGTIRTRGLTKLLDVQLEFRGAERIPRRHQERVTERGRAFTINFCCNHETRAAKRLTQTQIRISLARNVAKAHVGAD